MSPAPLAAEDLEVKPVLPFAPCAAEGEFSQLVSSDPRAFEDGEDEPDKPSALHPVCREGRRGAPLRPAR